LIQLLAFETDSDPLHGGKGLAIDKAAVFALNGGKESCS
jgi:hypothetical protein